MCGITGYIGTNAEENLIKNLMNLEYRGYDSAGIAVLNDEISVTKCAGKVEDLKSLVSDNKSTCGIAHTRWATHGAPTKVNAHPHLSNDKKWAVVHNGIIENFNEIKTKLKKDGYKFYSQTDTEVIANLLQDKKSLSPLQALIEVTNSIKGTYALACLNKDEKDTIYLAKNKSPLYITSINNKVILASDVICFADKTQKYYELNDNEYCIASKKNIMFYNKNGKIIKKSPKFLKNTIISNTKQNYEHFMLKEIHDTKKALQNIVKVYSEEDLFKIFNLAFIKKYSKIILIGCGTAYHACLMGAKFLQEYAKIDARAFIASEYRYANPLIDKKSLFIFVSQSGETADTLAVCELAKKNKATVIALTNVAYSSLAHSTKYVLPVCAGTEIAVASTKAYTAQIAILYMLAKHLQNVKFGTKYDYFNEILQIFDKIDLNYYNFSNLVDKLAKAKNVFFIGRNYDYITALEASLKLKEITYIFSCEHPAGELKHGFLALINKSSYLFAIATQKELLDKTLNNAYEAQARGAKVIFVTQFDLPKEVIKKFYKIIKLQSFNENVMPITSILPFQILAYYTSIKKGLNPDKPRNLAKSVTVEWQFYTFSSFNKLVFVILDVPPVMIMLSPTFKLKLSFARIVAFLNKLSNVL